MSVEKTKRNEDSLKRLDEYLETASPNTNFAFEGRPLHRELLHLNRFAAIDGEFRLFFVKILANLLKRHLLEIPPSNPNLAFNEKTSELSIRKAYF